MPDEFQRVTLPIAVDGGLQLDPREARAFGGLLSEEYAAAQPFPYIVVDDLLPAALADSILSNFPTTSLRGDIHHESGYGGEHKRQIFPDDCNEYVRSVFRFYNSGGFLQFLEGLTQVEELIPDPYYNGGGFHEIRRGGKLGVHADFRIHEQLHLTRRLNVLIYLNQNWNPHFGGELELWDKAARHKVCSIAPVFNRCVVFNTDEHSYHGHPDALNTPENVTRKSLALYYYTASKAVYSEVESHGTMYVARPTDGTSVRREVARHNAMNYVRDWLLPPMLYRQLRQTVRRFKRLAR